MNYACGKSEATQKPNHLKTIIHMILKAPDSSRGKSCASDNVDYVNKIAKISLKCRFDSEF